jgi:hypothetical protein
MLSKDDKKALEIIKKNITISIDRLVHEYQVKRCDIQLAWENTEQLYDYTIARKKVKEEDKVPLLILTHNYYLNTLLEIYKVNGRYYNLYPINKEELEWMFKDFTKNK